MTLVCCWWDQSYSRERITAIADARASVKDSAENWQALSDTTTKLMPVTVACHRIDDLDAETARLGHPYYKTEIGVGYAGYCFEALSIIELMRRCCAQLVTDQSESPLPLGRGLAELLQAITDRYFKEHSRPEHQAVEMVLFGYSAEGRPWIGTLKHKHDTNTDLAFQPVMDPSAVYNIGDGTSTKAAKALPALRAQIARHHRKSSKRLEPGFERDLHAAQHEAADKKGIEAAALDVVESEFMSTVGGVLQKLELYRVLPASAVAAYSHDRQVHLLEGLPEVSPSLRYAPMTEAMGL